MSWHLLLSIPLPSLPLSIEWLELRSVLLSISLPQPMTSNPQRKPYHSFSGPLKICLMDMSPYKKTELFARLLWWCSPRKKPRNTPLFGSYLSFLDSKQTVSTWTVFENCSTSVTRITSLLPQTLPNISQDLSLIRNSPALNCILYCFVWKFNWLSMSRPASITLSIVTTFLSLFGIYSIT